jgi:hypothetical protein
LAERLRELGVQSEPVVGAALHGQQRRTDEHLVRRQRGCRITR